MVVTEETHLVLITSITHLRSEAMRLKQWVEEHAAPLVPQMDAGIGSLTGLEDEIEDIRPEQDHDPQTSPRVFSRSATCWSRSPGNLDRAKDFRLGRAH